MEQITEETSSQISFNPNTSDPNRDLALKSGFLSLKERLMNWNRQSRNEMLTHGHRLPVRNATTEQFANLHEFFQSKSSLRKQLEQDAQMRAAKRPKIPVMKLSKQDWNVKCWEERTPHFREAARRKGDYLKDSGDNYNCPNRLQKPDIQVKAFNERVDEVSKKLEKVREGLPQDEQLYRLEMNRLYDQRREHSWTDQLKRELNQGAHDRNVLKKRIIEQQTSINPGDQRDKKSVLGRPIRKLFDDD